jgi:hypothetical protein
MIRIELCVVIKDVAYAKRVKAALLKIYNLVDMDAGHFHCIVDNKPIQRLK